MGGEAHKDRPRRRFRALAGMMTALVAAGAVSGCSTNLTGFQLPSFGLLKKNKDAQDPLGPAGVPSQTSRLESQ